MDVKQNLKSLHPAQALEAAVVILYQAQMAMEKGVWDYSVACLAETVNEE